MVSTSSWRASLVLTLSQAGVADSRWNWELLLVRKAGAEGQKLLQDQTCYQREDIRGRRIGSGFGTQVLYMYIQKLL